MVHTTSSNGLVYPQPTTMAAATANQNHPEYLFSAHHSHHYANLYPSYNQCLNNVNKSSSSPPHHSHYQNMPTIPTSSDNQANSFSTGNHQSYSSPHHNRAERQPHEYENTFGTSLQPTVGYSLDNTAVANGRILTTTGYSGMTRMTPVNNIGGVNSTSSNSSHILPNRPELLAASRTFESNSSTPLSRSRLALVKKTPGSRKANSLDRLNNETGTMEEKTPSTGRRSHVSKNLRPTSSLTGAAFFGQREDAERI